MRASWMPFFKRAISVATASSAMWCFGCLTLRRSRRWTCPNATPGAAPMPWRTRRSVTSSTILAETFLDEADDGVDGGLRLRVFTRRRQREVGAFGGREHEHAHDALGVHRPVVAADVDVDGELRRERHELRRRPRVQPEVVHDRHVSRDLAHMRLSVPQPRSM